MLTCEVRERRLCHTQRVCSPQPSPEAKSPGSFSHCLGLPHLNFPRSLLRSLGVRLARRPRGQRGLQGRGGGRRRAGDLLLLPPQNPVVNAIVPMVPSGRLRSLARLRQVLSSQSEELGIGGSEAYRRPLKGPTQPTWLAPFRRTPTHPSPCAPKRRKKHKSLLPPHFFLFFPCFLPLLHFLPQSEMPTDCFHKLLLSHLPTTIPPPQN